MKRSDRAQAVAMESALGKPDRAIARLVRATSERTVRATAALIVIGAAVLSCGCATLTTSSA
jgi:hypothetical protein